MPSPNTQAAPHENGQQGPCATGVVDASMDESFYRISGRKLGRVLETLEGTVTSGSHRLLCGRISFDGPHGVAIAAKADPQGIWRVELETPDYCTLLDSGDAEAAVAVGRFVARVAELAAVLNMLSHNANEFTRRSTIVTNPTSTKGETT